MMNKKADGRRRRRAGCAAECLILTLFLILSTMSSSIPLAHGTGSSSNPIKHVVVIMQENHSFDNYFGTYPGANGVYQDSQLNLAGNATRPFHMEFYFPPVDLCHHWTCAHVAYDNGKMDGFVVAAGSKQPYGYFDYHQIPYYWDYASRFVLMDNFFSSVMGGSFANHLYLVAGQSGGLVYNTQGTTSSHR